MTTRSWKTTLLGILAGLALLIPQAIAVLDGDPETVVSLEQIAAGLGAMGLGIFARDNDKMSEEVGAGRMGRTP